MIARKWLTFAGAASIFFFVSATTFQSLGVVLFAMANEFHWSEAAAGSAFLALGVVCAASSLLPVATIPRIGARWTMVAGTTVLAFGFLLAAQARSLLVFDLAAGLFGLAFSMVANTCGIYLTANWFGAQAPRMIGLYLVCGTISGVAGPPVAQALIAAGGWRLHWLVMAAIAAALVVLCAVLVRDPEAEPADPLAANANVNEWRLGRAMLTPQFALLTLAMVITQTCMLTVFGVAPPHLVRLGWSPQFAAGILSLQALVGTVATGFSGWLGERRDPKSILILGMIAQGAGMILLAYAHTTLINDTFAVVFGIGWAIVNVAITVLLIRYFGNAAGSYALSAVWMFCGLSTAGPSAAGWIADTTGSFAPALNLFGALSLVIGVVSFAMMPPRRHAATAAR